jgi:hypothetical protein
MILEAASPGNLKSRGFLTLNPVKEFKPDEAFSTMIQSIVSAVAPVIIREVTKDYQFSERRQYAMNQAYYPTITGGNQQQGGQDQEKFFGAFAAILPSILSSVLPVVMQQISGGQKSMAASY